MVNVSRQVQRVFSLSCEDAQDKDDWRLRIKGASRNHLPHVYLENGH